MSSSPNPRQSSPELPAALLFRPLYAQHGKFDSIMPTYFYSEQILADLRFAILISSPQVPWSQPSCSLDRFHDWRYVYCQFRNTLLRFSYHSFSLHPPVYRRRRRQQLFVFYSHCTVLTHLQTTDSIPFVSVSSLISSNTTKTLKLSTAGK